MEGHDGRFFTYGEKELEYLRTRDKALAAAIDRIGMLRRAVEPDLFAALVHDIVGQQISSKAQQTIWLRMRERFGPIKPEVIGTLSQEEIQACGISMRKAGYIRDAGRAVLEGALDLEALQALPDAQVCEQLSRLRGIGVWTAEMLMLFSMQRPDILSYDDLAIQRGLRMLYHHRGISRELFEKYRRRYSPHGSVASLYLWAIAGGEYGYRDYAPRKQTKKKPL